MRNEVVSPSTPLNGIMIEEMLKDPNNPLSVDFAAAIAKKELLVELIRYQNTIELRQAAMKRREEDALLEEQRMHAKQDNEQFNKQERDNTKAELQARIHVQVNFPELMPEITRFVLAVANLNSIAQQNQNAHADNQQITNTWATHRQQYAQQVVNSVSNMQVVLPGNNDLPPLTININLSQEEQDELAEDLARRKTGIDVIRYLPEVNQAYNEEIDRQKEIVIAEHPDWAEDTEENRNKIEEQATANADQTFHTEDRPFMLDDIAVTGRFATFLRKHNPEAFQAATERGVNIIQFLSNSFKQVVAQNSGSNEKMSPQELLSYLTKKRHRNDAVIANTTKAYGEGLERLVGAFDLLKTNFDSSPYAKMTNADKTQAFLAQLGLQVQKVSEASEKMQRRPRMTFGS